MAFKTIFWMTVATIGGIYLTSEEGKLVRESLLKKKSAFEPVVKDLIKQANQVLQGSKDVSSDEIRANIDILVSEAKSILLNIDLEKTTETIKEAIRVSSAKIRDASNNVTHEINKQKPSKNQTNKNKTPKKPIKGKASKNGIDKRSKR